MVSWFGCVKSVLFLLAGTALSALPAVASGQVSYLDDGTIRLDPVYSGQTGDYMDIQSITAEMPEPGGAMVVLSGVRVC